MNRNVIYIGDEKLDLSRDTVISQTLKRSDVGDLTTRSVNFTNSFNIPETPTNDRIYEYAKKVNSNTTIPYTRQTVKVVQNGIETITNGNHYIRKVDGRYQVYILYDAADFFDVLGNKKLNELDFEGLNGSWATDDIASYRSNTTGIVAPVMDYGNFISGSPNNINAAEYLPSVYYHTIINKIIEAAGYTKAGDIFTNAKYLKKILAYSRKSFYYDEDFVTARTASAKVASAQNIASPGSGTIVVFGDTVSQDSKGYWDGVDQYTVNETDANASGKDLFLVDILTTLNITVTGGTVDILVHKTGLGEYYSLLNKGTGTYTLNSKDYVLGDPGVIITEGESLSIRIRTNSGSPSVVVNSGSVVFNALNYVGTSSGSFAYFNHLLPDMTQSAFIKDFLMSFGLIPSEKNKVITFKTLNEIIANKAGAKDWTSKRVKVKDGLSFTPLDYAQENSFKYKSNGDTFDHAGIELEINANLGIGIFTISNDQITNKKTIYTSEFNNTHTELLAGIMMARIPINGTRQEFENEPGLRKLLVRDKYSFEPNVQYGSTSASAYKVAYFDSPDEAYSMSWEQSLDDHYSDWILALQTAKILTRKYLLSELDIIQIDFLAPIFDEDSYYLINEVKSFVPGQPTQVELFKVS